MIDYKQINKEISQKKWDRIHNQRVDEFTCYYSPGEGHSLCTHPDHCVLNEKFQYLHGKISWEKDYINKLEWIYNDAISLKEEFPDKDYSDFYHGFSLKDNRVTRRVVRNSMLRSVRELRDLKTKKGGF